MSRIKVPTLVASGVLAVGLSLAAGAPANADDGGVQVGVDWSPNGFQVGAQWWNNQGSSGWRDPNWGNRPDWRNPNWDHGCNDGCGNQIPWGWSQVAVASAWAGQGVRFDGSRGSTWFECPPNLPPGAFLAEWRGTVYWVS